MSVKGMVYKDGIWVKDDDIEKRNFFKPLNAVFGFGDDVVCGVKSLFKRGLNDCDRCGKDCSEIGRWEHKDKEYCKSCLNRMIDLDAPKYDDEFPGTHCGVDVAPWLRK